MSNQNRIIGLPVFLIIFLVMNACISSKKKEEIIIGEWEAEWEAMPQEGVAKDICRQMKGRVKFLADGKVEMTGYGHQGCIFSEDTLKNNLHWKFEQEYLSLQNVQDPFQMEYKVKEFSDNQVQLVLMQDIILKLSR
jgi:hypothetical protein